MKLNSEQQKQIDLQLANHKHEPYKTDVELAPGHVLKDFSVHKNVFRPDITSAIYLARWLFYNNGIYEDESVIDIGCGTGIQGLVAATNGAKNVTLSDISESAVQNANVNVQTYGLEDTVKVVKGDLFENVTGKADLVIFNHPFFPENPYKDVSVSKSMLGGETLLHRFFENSRDFLSEDGSIVTSYFHLAGDTNNPGLQGSNHGFDVYERFTKDIGIGLQRGKFSIYELILD
jgi:release factor glutamine methyltransferase